MMKIGQKALTLIAMAALSVGGALAQGAVSKPTNASNQPTASKAVEDQSNSQSGSHKKVDKHVHKHHHKKANKQPSSTPTQDSTKK